MTGSGSRRDRWPRWVPVLSPLPLSHKTSCSQMRKGCQCAVVGSGGGVLGSFIPLGKFSPLLVTHQGRGHTLPIGRMAITLCVCVCVCVLAQGLSVPQSECPLVPSPGRRKKVPPPCCPPGLPPASSSLATSILGAATHQSSSCVILLTMRMLFPCERSLPLGGEWRCHDP